MTKLNLYPSLNKSGFGEEQKTEPKFTMVSRKSWTTVLVVVVDVTIWIAVSLAGLVFAYNLTGLEPVTRGFFCDDQTIQYPYRPDSVKDSVVVIVSILIPAVVIFLIETARAVTHRESLGKTERSKLWSLIISLYRVIGIFLAGGSGTILVTEVLKLVSGRMRPHYFDVCQANFTKINCSLGYITPPADFCMNTDTKMLLDARKSFPSGHASLSAYGAMFLLIFLQRRFIWRHFKLIPPLIQMFIFSAGIYISISRVTDNKHHATDVIGGGIIGVVIAVFMIIVDKGSDDHSDHTLIDLDDEAPKSDTGDGNENPVNPVSTDQTSPVNDGLIDKGEETDKATDITPTQEPSLPTDACGHADGISPNVGDGKTENQTAKATQEPLSTADAAVKENDMIDKPIAEALTGEGSNVDCDLNQISESVKAPLPNDQK